LIRFRDDLFLFLKETNEARLPRSEAEIEYSFLKFWAILGLLCPKIGPNWVTFGRLGGGLGCFLEVMINIMKGKVFFQTGRDLTGQGF
jgi:hypothetical protein